MTLDELCRRLAVCTECDGDGLVLVYDEDGSSWDETCDACHGTGLDPERVEVLRGFERDVIERCAAACRAVADEARGHPEPKTVTGTVAKQALITSAMNCAAAIEGLGNTEHPRKKAT